MNTEQTSKNVFMCSSRIYILLLFQSNKSLEVLAKQLKKDLTNLLCCLRANKLCLNVQKMELITLHPNNLKLLV